MRSTPRLFILAALLLGAAFGQPSVIKLSVDDPPRFYGRCTPTRVHFTGHIATNGPMDVTYEWINGGPAPATEQKVLHFVRANDLTVNFDWTVTNNGSGWVAIRLVTQSKNVQQQVQQKQIGPTESNRVKFSITDCGPSKR